MRDVDGGSVFSRQHFLGLSVAGLAVAAFPIGQVAMPDGRRTFSHLGKEISVATDGGEELIVEGKSLRVISSNGAYRAAEFAFAPEFTLEDLGRRVAENTGRIPGRF